MEIGERLRELREDRDLTQKNISAILKTTQSYYSEYELGKRPIPNQHIITLSLFYGVSSDYILGLPKGLKWPR